jgi:chemotaxis response regulator CheB
MNDSSCRCGLKTVVIIHCGYPLLAGVEHLLSREDGFILTTVSSIATVDIVNEIEQLQPEIVILDESLPNDDFGRILDLLMTFLELRVVVVSHLKNQLQVYEKKQVLVNCFSDLILAVQNS